MRQSRQLTACRLHSNRSTARRIGYTFAIRSPIRVKSPFRVTTPDVCAPLPTEQPISLVSLKNHQITSQTFAAFKARNVSGIPVTQAETGTRDLAPGEKTTGVISIESSTGNLPQIYQLNFGADQNGPLKVEVVL